MSRRSFVLVFFSTIFFCIYKISTSILQSTSTNYKQLVFKNQLLDLRNYFFNKRENVCEMAFSIKVFENQYVTELKTVKSKSYQDCYSLFVKEKNFYSTKPWNVYVNFESYNYKKAISESDFQELERYDLLKQVIAFLLFAFLLPLFYCLFIVGLK
jgi:hypothetical protein